jgi:hypothetical protein
MKTKYLIFISFAFLYQCDTKNKIDQLLKSSDKTDIIMANHLICEANDTSYVMDLLDHSFDPRISHHSKFKGMSVYQSKMIALKKLSKLQPSKEITYKPDSTIILF